MRIIGLAALTLLVSCISVDLSKICPNKPITQGVFGKIVDSSDALEENVSVDAYTILNGKQDMLFATHKTTRGGYQFSIDPAPYVLCVKKVCTTVTVPKGLIEVSAVDAASGVKWDEPVDVPPEQMVGPCTFGK